MLAHDRRIAPHYLTAAMPFGGPCLPRDTAALAALGPPSGCKPAALGHRPRRQRWRPRRACRLDHPRAPGGCVGIHGLGFKLGTGIVEASPAADLARMLLDEGVRTIADPVVQPGAVQALGLDLELVGSFEECVARADVLVLAAPPRNGAARALGDGRSRTVIDCWRSVDRGRASASEWNGRTVLITGARRSSARTATALAARGAHVRIVDDYCSGCLHNLAEARSIAPLEIQEGDLQDLGLAASACAGVHTVFHSPPTTAVAGTSTPARPARRTTSRWTWACSALPPEPVFPRSCSPPPGASIPTSCRPTRIGRSRCARNRSARPTTWTTYGWAKSR